MADEPRPTNLLRNIDEIFKNVEYGEGPESVGQVGWQRGTGVGRNRIALKPSEFRQLVPMEPGQFKAHDETINFLSGIIRGETQEAGVGTLAPPWLQLEWVPEKSAWKVFGHEGRNRTVAAQRVLGDENLPVDVFLRSYEGLHRQKRIIEPGKLTPEMQQALENRRFIPEKSTGIVELPVLTQEPRSTDLVPVATPPEEEHKPGLPRFTGIGQVFRGLGSMIGGKKMQAVRKLIAMAQQGYELLPEDRKLLGEVLDMEALTKQIPGTGKGVDYFRQLLGMGPEEGGITSLPMDEASRTAFQKPSDLLSSIQEPTVEDIRRVLGEHKHLLTEQSIPLTENSMQMMDAASRKYGPEALAWGENWEEAGRELGFETDEELRILINDIYAVSERETEDTKNEFWALEGPAFERTVENIKQTRRELDTDYTVQADLFGPEHSIEVGGGIDPSSPIVDLILAGAKQGHDPKVFIEKLISDGLVPEYARDQAYDYFERATPVTKAHGGFINKPFYDRAV